MNRAGAVAFVLVFLMVSFAANAKRAEAQFLGLVVIKADGTVDRGDAPIQQIGEVYVLTSNVESIRVERSNVVLDGNGHTVPGVSSQPGAVSSYGHGVLLNRVENVTVKNLIVHSIAMGIVLDRATKCVITNNIVTGTHVAVPELQSTGGICVFEGNSNTITENHLSDNYGGIYLGYSQQNTITRNNITNSVLKGVIFSSDTSNNIIYYNNFVNNAMQVSAYEDKVNSWDNGSVGNFWSDYNGTDGNTDGIGDTPYVINANNQDRFPLTNPWDPARPIDTVPPRLTIVSPVHGIYNETSVPLTFHASEACSSMSYSLDGQDNLTVAGNTTLSGLSTGLHNVTVYAKDEFENTGASKRVMFTIAEEPEPFPVVPVATASVATIAAIGVGLLVYFKKRKH